MDIVPNSIAKIVSLIPYRYSIDWMRVWNYQEIYPALMEEIEKITKITNDFICDSHGVIVTEYCKKNETWESYRKVPYTLSEAFINSLVPLSVEKEKEETAKYVQKGTNEVKDGMALINRGAEYWQALLAKAMERDMLSPKEISILRVVVEGTQFPSAAQTRRILQIEKKD